MSTVERIDVGAIHLAERREDGGEVAAVAARSLDAAFHRRAGDRCGAARRGRFEVVPDSPAALRELVHPVERVPRGGAALELERGATLRRVAEEVEDGGHRLRR